MAFQAAPSLGTWKEAAACKGEPASVFFPETEPAAAAAKAICARCPVSDLCLTVALRNGERHGVWGGKTERERARLRRSIAKAA
ncbi:MAG: WhiB family transcriptional regulator [Acidimicrobiales bacterium]